jgi:hypothetical protein
MSLWDADIFTDTNYMSARLSHAGSVTFRSNDLDRLEEMRQQLIAAGLDGADLVKASTQP